MQVLVRLERTQYWTEWPKPLRSAYCVKFLFRFFAPRLACSRPDKWMGYEYRRL